jgi:hypothetical protein
MRTGWYDTWFAQQRRTAFSPKQLDLHHLFGVSSPTTTTMMMDVSLATDAHRTTHESFESECVLDMSTCGRDIDGFPRPIISQTMHLPLLRCVLSAWRQPIDYEPAEAHQVTKQTPFAVENVAIEQLPTYMLHNSPQFDEWSDGLQLTALDVLICQAQHINQVIVQTRCIRATHSRLSSAWMHAIERRLQQSELLYLSASYSYTTQSSIVRIDDDLTDKSNSNTNIIHQEKRTNVFSDMSILLIDHVFEPMQETHIPTVMRRLHQTLNRCSSTSTLVLMVSDNWITHPIVLSFLSCFEQLVTHVNGFLTTPSSTVIAQRRKTHLVVEHWLRHGLPTTDPRNEFESLCVWLNQRPVLEHWWAENEEKDPSQQWVAVCDGRVAHQRASRYGWEHEIQDGTDAFERLVQHIRVGRI